MLVIGQPVQYHSTKGAPDPEVLEDGTKGPQPFVTHPAVVQALGDGTATLKVFGPFGDYQVPAAEECPGDAPEAGKFNPLPA